MVALNGTPGVSHHNVVKKEESTQCMVFYMFVWYVAFQAGSSSLEGSKQMARAQTGTNPGCVRRAELACQLSGGELGLEEEHVSLAWNPRQVSEATQEKRRKAKPKKNNPVMRHITMSVW